MNHVDQSSLPTLIAFHWFYNNLTSAATIATDAAIMPPSLMVMRYPSPAFPLLGLVPILLNRVW